MKRTALLAGLVLVVGCDRGSRSEGSGHQSHAQEGATAASEHSAHGGLPGYAPVVVDEGRRQLLGIRTITVGRQPLAKRIRTVGLVGSDETRTSHVHVKFEGFIEDIYVNFTGQPVRKGQPLFKVYSRDLLAAEQEYLSARAGLPKLPPGPLGDSARGAAREVVQAARRRLELFDVPPAVLAQIERTGEAQRAITILSPQEGIVLEKQAIKGLAVTPMMHLYVIADLSRVWVVADVYERDLALVKIGQRATLTIDAYPGRTFTGLVTFVSPTLDETTRTAKVRFEFPNRDGALKPSMFATVALEADLGTGLAIPSDAIIDTGERKIVFVAHEGGHFEPRAIKVGTALEGAYQVLEGLKESEAIASQGQFLLDSESRIRGASKGAAPAHGGH
jgi:membrane fusion protein, copper/silver efflux system